MHNATAKDLSRALWERAARRALVAAGLERPSIDASPAAIPELPQIPPGAPGRFARHSIAGVLAVEHARASAVLYERLDDQDVLEVERQIDQTPQLRDYYASSSNPATRRHMVLAFAVHLQIQTVLEKTGLSAAQPPEDIHAMARGPVAAAGGLYEADLVVDALASAGIELDGVDRALDFGCSSGRVARVLSAAYPNVAWRGCDPNEPAVAWAQEEISGVEFFVSGDQPPLPLPESTMDLVYAISIWSHFEPALGLRWFDEMARLIVPGGHLVCTTHGLTSVGYYVLRGLRSPTQSDEILGQLYRTGSWYAAEFGTAGDWGVVNPDWGTAFLSPEWLLAHLCPRWRVLEFAPGRNQDNQDVYVLQRV